MALFVWILVACIGTLLSTDASIERKKGLKQAKCQIYVAESYQESYQEGYTCGAWMDQTTCYSIRYRTAYRASSRCCTGWQPSSGVCIPVCFGSTTCPNGGTCTNPDECSCLEGYFPPQCTQCTAIENCQIVSCTTSSDQTCTLCNDGYHPSPDGTQCLQSKHNLDGKKDPESKKDRT